MKETTHFPILRIMQNFNKYSRLLAVSTILYFFIQVLFSWKMDPSSKATVYVLISALVLSGNIFFFFYLSRNFSNRLLRIFNSYLLFSTFIFYMSYCMKASMISTDPEVLGAPFLLELLLLAVLIFNAYQIFIYSRELKKIEKASEKKKKHPVVEIFSWIDALLSAVIFVLVINIFLFQIYSIPSESMYPVFLIKDRPVVDKITRGPSLPFTRFRIPALKKIERGDIVTFRNPKYEKTVESELKHLFSQFLYMVTFTGVNLDRYDEFGNEKADPLVKRVVGVEGEQLQIINDVIYVREDLNSDFEVLEENIHSQTDLYKLPEDTLAKLRYLPIDKTMRDVLTKWDQKITALNIRETEIQIRDYASEAESIRTRLVQNQLDAVKGGLRGQYNSLNTAALSVNQNFHPLQKVEYLREDQIHFLYNMDNSVLWMEGWGFLTKTIDSGRNDMFREISVKTDLMYKSLVSRWMVINLEYLEFLINGSNNDLTSLQDSIAEQEEALGEFLKYLIRYYDFRNMPPFPENALIQKDHYFLMGDNRYNSVDLRHGLHSKDRYFIKDEESSLVYRSLLHPITIDESGIEGFVIFRLFPVHRIGIP